MATLRRRLMRNMSMGTCTRSSQSSIWRCTLALPWDRRNGARGNACRACTCTCTCKSSGTAGKTKAAQPPGLQKPSRWAPQGNVNVRRNCSALTPSHITEPPIRWAPRWAPRWAARWAALCGAPAFILKPSFMLSSCAASFDSCACFPRSSPADSTGAKVFSPEPLVQRQLPGPPPDGCHSACWGRFGPQIPPGCSNVAGPYVAGPSSYSAGLQTLGGGKGPLLQPLPPPSRPPLHSPNWKAQY